MSVFPTDWNCAERKQLYSLFLSFSLSLFFLSNNSTFGFKALPAYPLLPFTAPGAKANEQKWEWTACADFKMLQQAGEGERRNIISGSMTFLHLLQSLSSPLTAERERETGRGRVNLWELRDTGEPADFSGNMSAETITFLTTKFNYSLNWLWSRALPLIEAFTCGLSKMSLHQAWSWKNHPTTTTTPHSCSMVLANPCLMGASWGKCSHNFETNRNTVTQLAGQVIRLQFL